MGKRLFGGEGFFFFLPQPQIRPNDGGWPREVSGSLKVTQQGMPELSLSLSLFLLGPARPPFPMAVPKGPLCFPNPNPPAPGVGTGGLPRSSRHLGNEAGFVAAPAAGLGFH